jgi:ankyrin repeat protein
VIVDAKDNTGRSALIWAGELGRMEVVRELLKHARVDVSLMPRICEDQVKVSRESLSSQKLDVIATKDQGPSAIILASGSGRLQRLPDVSRVGNLDGIVETGFGHTILMIASNRVSADIVGGLLNHWRVTVNVNNGYDFNAFVSARHSGHAQMVHEFSSSSLFMASALGRADVDDGLSKRVKLDVSAMTSRDRSAFTLANANDHLQIVGEVLRFMNANAVGNDGCTALSLASEDGHFAVALLKEKDVDASDKDDNGTTTSMLASGSGHSAVFRRSSEHECVDLIAVDDNGQIELMSAIDEDRLEGCS